MIQITLNQIKAHNPRRGGWKILLQSLGKTKVERDEQKTKLIEVVS